MFRLSIFVEMAPHTVKSALSFLDLDGAIPGY